MDQNDRNEFEPPPPPAGTEPDDIRIVEATAVPEYTGADTPAAGTPAVDPMAAPPEPRTVEPTRAFPVVQPGVPAPPPVAHVPVAEAPVAQLHTGEPFVEDRQPAWPYVAAVVALLLGGLIGFLIAGSDDDDEVPPDASAPSADIGTTLDMLLTRTRTDGEFRTPSEFPQLDEIVAIDNAAATRELQEQIDVLTAAQEESAGLAEQVATLETELATVTAERDELAAQAEETGDDGDLQADLDEANARIETLEAELGTARTDLTTANEAVADAEAALQTAIEERDAANATIAELNIVPNPDYVDGDVDAARDDASENGWTLIEQPVESETDAPGTILDQAPPPNSNMIDGSVLFVTVAEAP